MQELDVLGSTRSTPMGESATSDPWEDAYLRFETPEQEIAKFVRRLRSLGAEKWRLDSQIVELFCGRGNGLKALALLGFRNLEGVDISPRLLACYRGPAICHVGDCRKIPLPDHSRDVLIVQGGLHHLTALPESLEQTLLEVRRVLRPGGYFVAVEPWLTPFLKFVHVASANRAVRRFSTKLDALATMIDYERPTYEQWLSQPRLVSELVRSHFRPIHESTGWGKWKFIGSPL